MPHQIDILGININTYICENIIHNHMTNVEKHKNKSKFQSKMKVKIHQPTLNSN